MDRAAFEGILTGWRATGDPRLLGVALEAAAKLIHSESDTVDPAEAGELLKALESRDLTDETASDWIAGARLRLACGEAAAALSNYQRAVTANPTVEDPQLAQEIDRSLSDEAQETLDASRNVVSIDALRGAERSERLRADTDAMAQASENRAASAQRLTFADVGGLTAVKDEIRRKIITPFRKPSLFRSFKRKAGGGVLLYGPPGVGKTLLARATAGEIGARFVNVSIAEVLDLYLGESEKRLAALFAEARRETPSVMFFDELEALAGRREQRMGDAKASLVSAFLAELDGFASRNEGVLVLAATNAPWSVDPAFRRPGRFDRIIFTPPPDREAREAILALQLAGRPGAEQIDAMAIARETGGFSGADLANLVETAVDHAIDASIAAGAERPLDMNMMRSALSEVSASTLEWLSVARNYTRYSNTGGQYDAIARFLEEHGR